MRWLMMFGLTCFAVSMWSFSFITHDWGADQLLLPQGLRGFMSGSTSQLTPVLGSMPAAHAASLKLLWNLAYREASTMAYADAFRTVGIICLLATCLVPLLKRVAQTPPPRQTLTRTCY